MTDKVIKLRNDIDYLDLKYWNSEEAEGLRYFLNKAVVNRQQVCYNKKVDVKTTDQIKEQAVSPTKAT